MQKFFNSPSTLLQESLAFQYNRIIKTFISYRSDIVFPYIQDIITNEN